LSAELTAIWIADATHEAMRDLVRAGATGPYWCCGCFIAPQALPNRFCAMLTRARIAAKLIDASYGEDA